jgi:hypothetical protein
MQYLGALGASAVDCCLAPIIGGGQEEDQAEVEAMRRQWSLGMTCP